MLPSVSLTFFAPVISFSILYSPPLLMNVMWTLLVWLHFDFCPIPFRICLSSAIDFWFDLSLPSPTSCKLCILCWINISDLQLLCSQKSASGSLSLRPLWHKRGGGEGLYARVQSHGAISTRESIKSYSMCTQGRARRPPSAACLSLPFVPH